MKIIREEDKEKYHSMMDEIACTVYGESLKSMEELQKHYTDKEVVSSSETIGLAVGQIVLDKVIDLTKDMSREDIVRYFADASAQLMTIVMNRSEEYRVRIMFLNKLRK